MSNGFDVAIGMTQAELDAISQSLYSQVYPQLFTGSQQQEYSGIQFTVAWDIKTAAVFDLSDPSGAQAALREHLATLSGPEGQAPEDEHLDIAASSAAAFAFTYQTVNLEFSSPGVDPGYLTIPLTAQAHMAVSGNTQSMVVDAMTAPKQTDPANDWLVQHVVLPAVLAASQKVFGGVTIPPLSVPGLTLGPPVPFVQSQTLIAIANVAGEGVPAVPGQGSFGWPSSQFFTLISGNAFQSLTTDYVNGSQNSRSDSGSGGSHWAGYDWSYSLGIGSPATAIQGDGSVILTADVQGSVSASAYIVYIPIGIGYTAYASPGLEAFLGLEVQGSSLVVKTRQVAPFVLNVLPSGSVSDKIAGWILEAIAEGVVNSFSPFISLFLGGITFASFAIPTYSVTVGNVTLTVAPTNLQVGNVGGMLALTGGVSITT